MFLPSIAFAAFLAVAANARGDGSATLQLNDKGIEDKQHGKYVALVVGTIYILYYTDTLYHSNNIPRLALHHTSSNRSS